MDCASSVRIYSRGTAENPEQGFLTKSSWLPANFVGNAAGIIKALRRPAKRISNYLFIYAIKAHSCRAEVSILIHYTNSRNASVTAHNHARFPRACTLVIRWSVTHRVPNVSGGMQLAGRGNRDSSRAYPAWAALNEIQGAPDSLRIFSSSVCQLAGTWKAVTLTKRTVLAADKNRRSGRMRRFLYRWQGAASTSITLLLVRSLRSPISKSTFGNVFFYIGYLRIIKFFRPQVSR